MSGIFGIYSKTIINDPMLSVLKKWNQAYGLDANESVVLDHIVFGAAINRISQSRFLSSPVLHVGEVYAVIDAVVYNRDEVLKRLNLNEDYTFSDERLVLEIWLKEGTCGLQYVNGDFAGAVYDGRKLYLFRDHLGVRPLYWYMDEQQFVFSTDLRGILRIPGLDLRLNEEYLLANVCEVQIDLSEITDFARIKAIRTASVLEIDAKESGFTTKYQSYWKPGKRKICFDTKEKYQERLRELVVDAINRRIKVADAEKIGMEISGGLDSTVIAVLAKKAGADLIGYSWSPPINQTPLQDKDERIIIEQICTKYGIPCFYNFWNPDMETEKSIMRMEKEQVVPDSNTSYIADAMSIFSSKGARIGISGWGGDEGVSHRSNILELWMHHERYAYMKLQWSRARGPFRILRFGKRVLKNLIVDRDAFLNPSLKKNDIPDILKDEYVAGNIHKMQLLPFYFGIDPVSQIQSGGNRSRLEMAAIYGAENNIQYVFPFLDYRVMDYAVSVPRHLYLNQTQDRVIFRDTFQEEMGPLLYNLNRKIDVGFEKAREERRISETVIREYIRWMENRWDDAIWEKYFDNRKVRERMQRWIADPQKCYDELSVVFAIERCLRIQCFIK